MLLVETDPVSGAEIHQLTTGPLPADDIYGEQPYSPPDSSCVTVCDFNADGKIAGLRLLGLPDGAVRATLPTAVRFPAFHAWGEYLYYQELVGPRLLLRRCRYATGQVEDVLALPEQGGKFSYGTVSPDHRWYAVSVHYPDKTSEVRLYDVTRGGERVLVRSTGQLYKHEQFSRDGQNRVLIQANAADVSVVNLGWMAVDGEGVDWFAVDAPPLVPIGRWPGGARHTPRCTGHETWVGPTASVFCSTGGDKARGTNIWTVAVGAQAPTAVPSAGRGFGHVSVSACGRYWLGDAIGEPDIPIYVGSFASGSCARLLASRTKHDGKQWTHTHPYLTADNRWLVFNSSRSGSPQVHVATVPPAFLAALDRASA